MAKKEQPKKKPKNHEVIERLNDNLILQQTLGNGIAVENIKRLIKFFEKK